MPQQWNFSSFHGSIVSLGISTLGMSLSFTLLPGKNISVAVVGSSMYQRQILYDVGRGTINQLPVAVCVCEREREANTAGRVCFLDAKQLLPKASAAVMRTKASVGVADALISV
jgi:hypothetical protein